MGEVKAVVRLMTDGGYSVTWDDGNGNERPLNVVGYPFLVDARRAAKVALETYKRSIEFEPEVYTLEDV